MPKCEKIKSREMVYLPSSEMCRVTSEPCRILYHTGFFKEFLKCHDTFFPCRNCSNDVREMKFNATGQCLSPLVQTESSMNHYKGRRVFYKSSPYLNCVYVKCCIHTKSKSYRYRRMWHTVQRSFVYRRRA